MEIKQEDVIPILNELQKLGYIKILNHNGEIMLRNKLLNNVEPVKDDFIEEYTKLWEGIPKIGGKSGYYVKQPARFNAERMQKYIKEFGTCQEDILLATKKYIEEKKSGGYQYMKKSHKFIMDSESSELYLYVQSLKEKEVNTERIEAI